MTYDRWNPPLRTVTTEHDHPVFVPPAEPYGAGDHVTTHPAGFRVRTRGDVTGEVVHAYRCPVHGLVDVSVPRTDVPDEVSCSLMSWSVAGCDEEYASAEDACRAALEAGCRSGEASLETQVCADRALWAGSSCGIGVASGEVTS